MMGNLCHSLPSMGHCTGGAESLRGLGLAPKCLSIWWSVPGLGVNVHLWLNQYDLACFPSVPRFSRL